MSNPDPRRTLLFLLKEGQILLALKKRGFGEGKWNGVGGKLDPGETVEQAMIRECQEEIEVTPIQYKKVAILNFYGNTNDTKWHLLIHAYFCTKWQGKPVETEEMAPKWYNQSKLPYQNMWEDDPHWLPLVINNKLITGTFHFDGQDHLTKHSTKEVKAKELI